MPFYVIMILSVQSANALLLRSFDFVSPCSVCFCDGASE